MDKGQALQAFWESFNLPAYEENTVPDGAVLPYLTYSFAEDSFGNMIAMSADVWYKGTSWASAEAKAAEISASISYGGRILNIDNGAIWLQRGTPFAQRVPDENDTIRRIAFNIQAEYFTAN